MISDRWQTHVTRHAESAYRTRKVRDLPDLYVRSSGSSRRGRPTCRPCAAATAPGVRRPLAGVGPFHLANNASSTTVNCPQRVSRVGLEAAQVEHQDARESPTQTSTDLAVNVCVTVPDERQQRLQLRPGGAAARGAVDEHPVQRHAIKLPVGVLVQAAHPGCSRPVALLSASRPRSVRLNPRSRNNRCPSTRFGTST